MKKMMTLLLALSLVMGLLAGCGANQQTTAAAGKEETTPATVPVAQIQAETVTTPSMCFCSSETV